ncbi:hypothetical protein HME9302_00276 [Alteripontixanthobacter maritimus]|uniref:Ubiquinol-cytochrome c chaperone domain-containing protein n=1 Tax=Alteripontixanthobacter maritimus TaxID=2161824 RepID=A0A369Q730_9SPHN|nr:ubiquinol-cytochrome C chaperone family protein [Alteripontixanthobacter maritimus]RDC59097.1 hypothetical protein HME9302_00276 [Alteripontixanthobacter maritimus]
MSFLSRLFGTEPDPREAVRPLWHRVVELARAPYWYAECGVEDTVEGRFDMVTAVLCVALVRLEEADGMHPQTARLTELFVEDMDGQLREFGTNDVVVGKRMGKLMSTLGGRIGAYRKGLTGGPDAMTAAVGRNVSMATQEQGDAGTGAACVANGLMELKARLDRTPDADLSPGRLAE